MNGQHSYSPVPADELEEVVSAQQSYIRANGDSAHETIVKHKLAQLGLAKIFFEAYRHEILQVETESVYGAALAMPQIARSAGWPTNLILLTIRAYLFHALNMFLQGFFLYMLSMEEEIIDKFAGQMFLCSFGASTSNCPGAPGCVGPGGSQFNPEHMYSFETWETRSFVRESLLQLFPEMTDEIMSKVNVGEYGQESQSCRIVCCFLFVASLIPDLFATIHMARTLCILPTAEESWVKYDGLPGSEPKIVVSGMPLRWKILNVVCVFIPRALLWKLTAAAGMHFLLDTGNIVDVIVNTIALNFVLTIDEILFATITTRDTKEIMANLVGFTHQVIDTDQDEDRLLARKVEEANHFSLKAAVPLRLLAVIVLACVFVGEYYMTNCEQRKDGGWVSKPVFMPAGLDYPILSFLLPAWFPVPSKSDVPFWSMDEVESDMP